MTRSSKFARLAVAGVLAISVLAGTAGAQAAPTSGSMVADGIGGVTVTFDIPAERFVVLLILEAGTTCPATIAAVPDVYEYGLILAAAAIPPAGIGEVSPQNGPQSPLTITTGTLVSTDPTGLGPEDTPLPAGLYQFCMVEVDFITLNLLTISSLEAQIGGVAPTTTAAPTTTTTAAPAAPATPKFTG